jgi:hypothetical protein
MKSAFGFIGTIFWVAGIVLAQGFWSTFFAIFVPLWAWYISVQHLMVHFGLL